jgi:hypothetical protein
MTRTPDTERLIRAYLDEGLNELPDRVYEVIRSDIDRTRQRVVIGPWRTPDMSTFAKLAMAAAAVVVVALVGYNLLPGSGGVGGAPASPSPSISASAPPSASIAARPSDAVPNGALQPGTYTAYGIASTTVNMRFTVPAGWSWVEGGFITPVESDRPDPVTIAFWSGDLQVYGNPCKWQGTEPNPPTGPTAREFVNALAAQPTRNASAPLERKAAGPGGSEPSQWPGWSVDLTVPTDADFSQCDNDQFRSWGPEPNERYHQAPGQRDTVWAIDTDGGRIVVLVASFPDEPAKRMTESKAILDSMEFSSGS